jgi:hypothetical protein
MQFILGFFSNLFNNTNLKICAVDNCENERVGRCSICGDNFCEIHQYSCTKCSNEKLCINHINAHDCDTHKKECQKRKTMQYM